MLWDTIYEIFTPIWHGSDISSKDFIVMTYVSEAEDLFPVQPHTLVSEVWKDAIKETQQQVIQSMWQYINTYRTNLLLDQLVFNRFYN